MAELDEQLARTQGPARCAPAADRRRPHDVEVESSSMRRAHAARAPARVPVAVVRSLAETETAFQGLGLAGQGVAGDVTVAA